MFNISSFLSKLSKNIHSLEVNNEQIVDIIEKQIQVKIPLNDLEIKNNIILIRSNPAVKNKIFIFKTALLEEINRNTQTKIIDIR